jgi:fructokinase
MTAGTGVLVTVIGEALIDLIPGEAPRSFTACPAGSPFNVAIGLARLGQSTALMARMSDNAFGRMLRPRAADEGIHLGAAPRSGEPTTMAVVSLCR